MFRKSLLTIHHSEKKEIQIQYPKTKHTAVPVEVVKKVIKEVNCEFIDSKIQEVPVEVVKEIIIERTKEIVKHKVKEVPVEIIIDDNLTLPGTSRSKFSNTHLNLFQLM